MQLDFSELYNNIIATGQKLQAINNVPRILVVEDNPEKTRCYYVMPDGSMKEEVVQKPTPAVDLAIHDFGSFMAYFTEHATSDDPGIIKIDGVHGSPTNFVVRGDFVHRKNRSKHGITLYPRVRPELQSLLGYPTPLTFSPRELLVATTNAMEFLDDGGKALPALLSSVSTSLSKVKSLDQNSVTIVQAGGSIRIGITLAEGQTADRLPAQIVYQGPMFLGVAQDIKLTFDLTFEVVDGECEFTLTPSLLPVVMHEYCEILADTINKNLSLPTATLVIF